MDIYELVDVHDCPVSVLAMVCGGIMYYLLSGIAVNASAIAEAHLAEKFNKPGYPVYDHYTFALGGDGCMMEGISSEAFSLAGTLGLSKLIVIYDSNNISIEGDTDAAFTEDVQKRMEAFGFQTIDVADGTDLAADLSVSPQPSRGWLLFSDLKATEA